MELDEKKIPIVFKAFCDENRIKILKLLLTGEKCACVLLDDMHITQPTLSHHMKILCDSGIVAGRKEGKWMHYSISADGVKYVAECLQALTNTAYEDKSCCDK
ncbi:ArsR/SmtB family transcription factor [Lacrimispora sp. 210928-DFI.3.58]|uniref:ArsR/SmtB family transcription factor n=1 Tax=Lacrimispora sp. 210928-DFI.3.58 TaxID=2883214 RepID=UPI0015B56007|nr:metalloregulator ArsR/SmtB family transcription factor [Lacrimispora sp. 210928-DFI.3.58]MCB7319805.1 metalloregulator ArsR/SmtB family transcription factor [Lacrimispora sp. 210928-DFI.3.58]